MYIVCIIWVCILNYYLANKSYIDRENVQIADLVIGDLVLMGKLIKFVQHVCITRTFNIILGPNGKGYKCG